MSIKNDGRKIYAQLAPAVLNLPPYESQKIGRKVSSDELHMTLLHFGKISEIYRYVSNEVFISEEKYLHELKQFIARTKATLPDHTISLRHTGYAMFGPRRSSLVATFSTTPELRAFHQKLYKSLLTFLANCNLPNSKSFAKNHHSLLHAHTLEPHVTLYKGYKGSIPTLDLGNVTFYSMEVVY